MSNSIYSISQSNSRCDFQSEEGENTEGPGAGNRVHHLVKEHCQCAYFRSQHYSKPSFFLAGTSVEKRSKEESGHDHKELKMVPLFLKRVRGKGNLLSKIPILKWHISMSRRKGNPIYAKIPRKMKVSISLSRSRKRSLE